MRRSVAAVGHRAGGTGACRRGLVARAGAGLARPDRGDEKLNHWTLVDAENALATADGDRAGRRAAVRGRADRDQGPVHAGRGAADGAGVGSARRVHAGLRLWPGAPAQRGRLRDRRQDPDARVRHPAGRPSRAASARRATRGTRRARPAARAAARRARSRPAWCRSRTPATAAARSASRRPAAGCSASSRRAGGSRAAPDLGDHFLVDRRRARAHGRGRRGAARPDAGSELGDATWAPPPEAPFARAGEARPGQAARRAGRRDAARRRRARPRVRARRARGREAAASRSATTSRRSRRRSRAASCWSASFTALWAANVAASVMHGQIVSGNQPTAREHRAAVDVALRDGPEHSRRRHTSARW